MDDIRMGDDVAQAGHWITLAANAAAPRVYHRTPPKPTGIRELADGDGQRAAVQVKSVLRQYVGPDIKTVHQGFEVLHFEGSEISSSQQRNTKSFHDVLAVSIWSSIESNASITVAGWSFRIHSKERSQGNSGRQGLQGSSRRTTRS